MISVQVQDRLGRFVEVGACRGDEQRPSAITAQNLPGVIRSPKPGFGHTDHGELLFECFKQLLPQSRAPLVELHVPVHNNGINVVEDGPDRIEDARQFPQKELSWDILRSNVRLFRDSLMRC